MRLAAEDVVALTVLLSALKISVSDISSLIYGGEGSFRKPEKVYLKFQKN
jgi:hypothetical protein